jgi:hypothetical protein
MSSVGHCYGKMVDPGSTAIISAHYGPNDCPLILGYQKHICIAFQLACYTCAAIRFIQVETGLPPEGCDSVIIF